MNGVPRDLWELSKLVPKESLREKIGPLDLAEFDKRQIDALCRRLCYVVSAAVDEAGNSAALGLAAPQLGIPLPIVAMKAPGLGTFAMVNPEIVQVSNASGVEVERCFSTGRDVEVRVRRSLAVTVSYVNEAGLPVRIDLDGEQARVAQHEIDHLHGTLITDRAHP